MEEDEMEMEGEVVVGQMPTVMVPRHINKRALKNKALSVGFNDKELRDFVTGFHKRKKKRRKEAEKQLQEKERLRRIEARKKRKQEKELALYGRVLSSENPAFTGSEHDDADDADNDYEKDELDLPASVSETKTYEDGPTKITVTTREISHEYDDLRPNPVVIVPKPTITAEKNNCLAPKKKPLKKVSKQKSSKNKKKKSGLRKKDKRVRGKTM
ncbi:uncharacterized protein [Typha angustifolia]|uniref:uncharacterized protein n=1 Tax=Typha angustifolia TaxID=59011 RepID=UPI003C2EAC75